MSFVGLWVPEGPDFCRCAALRVSSIRFFLLERVLLYVLTNISACIFIFPLSRQSTVAVKEELRLLSLDASTFLGSFMVNE